MLFPTIDFAIFFAVVFCVGWALARRPAYWKVAMIVASYVFYGWWDWRFVFLLLASTIINQAGALSLGRTRRPGVRRTLVTATLAADLGLLGWFKYYGFLALNVDQLTHLAGWGSPLPLLAITLPVAISFFTFMGMSYVIDVYRDRLTPATWVDAATFLSFFPHLVAGPIVRGSELLPQLRRRRDPSGIDFPRAAWLIFAGLFKKVVISSYLSSAIVDPVFAVPSQHSSLEALFAVYGYAVQIYADFSGYTDIAIGIALLLGVEFPPNFDAPYSARSLQDFWRRWHMTLSRWLRDYLYIPLGGSRGSWAATARNIMITMVLGGLWHGAGWTFVAWGALHGIGQVVGHRRHQRRIARGLPALPGGWWRTASQRFVTFQLVCLGWVFFRATSFSNALDVLRALLRPGPAPLVTAAVLAAVGFGIFSQYLPAGVPARLTAGFARLAPVAQGAVLAGVLLMITTLGPPGVAPFIYFRF